MSENFLPASKLKRIGINLNWPLLIVLAILIAYGLIVLYSASSLESGRAAFYWQVCFTIAGIVIALLITFFDYHIWVRLAYPFYIIVLILLVGVLLFGAETYGAQRWLQVGPITIQPSELAKIALILVLAKEFSAKRENERPLSKLFRTLGLLVLPFVLVFEQPDLGTSIVLLFIYFLMGFAANTPLTYLLSLGGGFLAFSPAVWYLLKDYQKNRILVLFNPEVDPLGIGYNLRQSLVTIGSGQFLGKGYLKGSQKLLQFLPVRHADFIFAVLAEELGFLGVTVLLVLYGLLFYLTLTVAQLADDDFGRLIAIGVFSLWLSHVLINIGMTVGLMPITGIWLPFFSYGGSNVIINFFAIGLLFSIAVHRRRFLFYPEK